MKPPQEPQPPDYPRDPLDRDFEMYEDYLLGKLDATPAVPSDLSPGERDLLYRKRAFLEWKYEDGFEEAQNRHPEDYRYLELIRGLLETEEKGDDSHSNGQ